MNEIAPVVGRKKKPQVRREKIPNLAMHLALRLYAQEHEVTATREWRTERTGNGWKAEIVIRVRCTSASLKEKFDTILRDDIRLVVRESDEQKSPLVNVVLESGTSCNSNEEESDFNKDGECRMTITSLEEKRIHLWVTIRDYGYHLERPGALPHIMSELCFCLAPPKAR